MTQEKLIHNLQEGINSVPCRYCGRIHRVSLNFAHSAANSSTEGILGYSFSDGTCEEHKKDVGDSVRIKMQSFLTSI